MEQNLTHGPVWKTVLRFSLPFLLSYFLQTFYGMADLYIIGRFCGLTSTTAVSIGSQVMHMLTVMIVGLSMGAVVNIGQAVGAGDRQKLSDSVGNTVTLFLSLSVAATAILLLCVRWIVSAVSAPADAADGTVSYLTICFLGIPFITAYNMISAVLRGMGDSKTPLYLIALSCLTNILLDYGLIGGLQMGPAGAALGTVLSQTVSVLLALLVIRRQKLPLSGENFHPNRQVTGQILKIGIPVALQDGFIQIAFLTITAFANHRGLEDAAAVGVVEKMIGFLFLVPSSMLQTVSTLTAQNIGAEKYARARQVLCYACAISVIWGLFVAVLMRYQSENLISMFLSSPRAVELGCQYMKGYVWDCMLAGIHFSFSGFFCAWGLSGLSFLHNALSIVCVRIPLSYVAARYFKNTLFPMGLASPAGSGMSVLICFAAYFWLRKRQKKSGI